MARYSFLLMILSVACLKVSGQTVSYTDTLYPDKDAMIDDQNPATNYGSHDYFITESGENAEGPFNKRSLIDFDLSSLPSNATITGATLRLTGNGHLNDGGTPNGNASYLSELEGTWSETGVTWQNQPGYTTVNQKSLEASGSANQVYQVDVSDYCQNKFSEASGYYGFILRLQEEMSHNALKFNSSDIEDATHPQLIVTYTIPKIQVDFEITNIDVVADGDSSYETKGAIDLTVSDGVAPYTYSWSNSETTQDIDSLDVGTYEVTVQDSLGDSQTLTLGVGYMVDWDYFLLMKEVRKDTLEQTRNNNNFWNGGAATNILADGQDGWFEYTIPNTAENKAIGFSIWNREDRFTYGNIEYGVFVNSSDEYKKLNTGTQTYLSDYAADDVLRVEKRNDTVFCHKNGQQLGYHANVPSGDMYIQASIWHQGGMFESVRTSIKPAFPLEITRTPISYFDSVGGKTQVDPYAGSGAYLYSWEDGEHYTSYLEDTVKGYYDIEVTDSLSGAWKNHQTIGHGYDLFWEEAYQVTEAKDTLTRTEGNGDWLAGARSINYLEANEDGWIEYIVPDSVTENIVFGLDPDPDTTYDYTNFLNGFILYDDSTFRRIKDGSVNGAVLGSYDKGDIFRIERSTDTVLLIKNNHIITWNVGTQFTATDTLYAVVSIKDSASYMTKMKASFRGTDQPATGYAGPGREENSNSALVRGDTYDHLYFVFDENYDVDEQDLDYTIYNHEGEVSGLPVLKESKGLNKYKIDLKALNLSSGYYFLEVKDVKGEKKYLKIKYEE